MTGARPLTGHRINKSQLRELMQRVVLSPRPSRAAGYEGKGISIARIVAGTMMPVILSAFVHSSETCLSGSPRHQLLHC